MSLVGQLPLAAIWLSCKNLEESKKFYRDILGLRIIEEDESESGDIHFDLGNIRLSLISRPAVKGEAEHVAGKLTSSDQLIFVVENALDKVFEDLSKRGVKFRSKKIIEDSMGKAAWFNDPDGRVIYLWQPPSRDSKNYKGVETLVRHYESVSRALADLREEEIAV
jgi:catechol 2,3-dioxygenase-like lactoylglutathione lyase family enzyme